MASGMTRRCGAEPSRRADSPGILARHRSTRKRIFLASISAGVLVVALVLYLLADRYLIAHVQIDDVQSFAAAATGTIAVATTSPVPAATTSAAAAQTPAPAAAPAAAATVLDDWNYRSGTASITIREVSTGSGSTAVVYYVADVTVTEATVLRSAFARNRFGTNVIETTSDIADDNEAIFAVNGDYYGFRDDGIVIRNGIVFRDAPARTGLALYRDGTMRVYDETTTTAKRLLASGVWNTLSFGPALLIDSAIPAGIDRAEVDTNFGNHSIQGNQPRTGIGIVDANHFVFVVVDGRSAGYSRGVTMRQFAEIFRDLGCTTAYNLDGGGSSTMYFNGRVVNNPLGRNRERGTSDILLVAKEA